MPKETVMPKKTVMSKETVMRIFLTSTLLLTAAMAAIAQPPTPTPDAQLAEMEKLAWLVGIWEGEGWMEMRPGQKHEFKGAETVESRLGGVLILVEGFHRAAETNEIVHHAFGMITWDEKEGIYRFRTQLANGRASDSTGKLEDGAFVWSPPAPPGVEIRYIIREDKNGDWYEIGEMSYQGQKTRKFFEMRLKKTG